MQGGDKGMARQTECLNCGHEFELNGVSLDGLGWYTSCPACNSSFDITDRDVNEAVIQTKSMYPTGCRVELVSMNDPYNKTLKRGDKGTVTDVDDVGTVHIAWDSGSSLGAVLGVDKVKPCDT
jgi:hypothetical protein